MNGTGPSERIEPGAAGRASPGVIAQVASAVSAQAAAAATSESLLTSQQVRQVDAREEEIMGVQSPEGTPPEHWLRSAEWKWFRYLMVAVFLGAVVWIGISGVSGGTVLMAAALVVVMVFAAAPVWGAAILRAREGRAARAAAIEEIQTSSGAGKAFPGTRHCSSNPDVQVICVKEDSHV